MSEYKWEDPECDGYESLYRPDGSWLADLTEPEDRISCRDLAPITKELNKLQSENESLRKQVVDLRGALDLEVFEDDIACLKECIKNNDPYETYLVGGQERKRISWCIYKLAEVYAPIIIGIFSKTPESLKGKVLVDRELLDHTLFSIQRLYDIDDFRLNPHFGRVISLEQSIKALVGKE